MIQRIQSVYLVLAGLLGVVRIIYGYYHVEEFSAIVIGFLSFELFFASLSFFTLLQFKNRTRQINLSYLIVMWLAFQVFFEFIYFFGFNVIRYFNALNFIRLIPIIQFVLIFLALRAIKKDEELIRSVDRIR
jgi:hypothetical protein